MNTQGISDWSSVKNAKKDCSKCQGTGIYNATPVGTAHWTPCDLCCAHDEGYWLLPKDYVNAGKWSCLAGCGHVLNENPNAS